MAQAPRLSRVGAMTVALSVIAFSCSSDIVELLPLTAGASNGGAGGSAGQEAVTSGTSTGGGNAAGMTTQGGFAGAPQAGAGHSGSGGNSGSSGGACFGFGCAGESGFGGSFGGSFGGPFCGNGNSCAPCANDDTQCPFEYEHCAQNVCVQCSTEGPGQCWLGANCDVLVGRCVPACERKTDCNDGRVCDLNHGTCVWCIDDRECDGGEPKTSTCYLHRCVECTQDADCNAQGGSRRCFNLRCVQPCVSDKDCDPNGRSHCDVKGFCE